MKFQDMSLQELEQLVVQCKRDNMPSGTIVFSSAETEHASITARISAMKLSAGGLSWSTISVQGKKHTS